MRFRKSERIFKSFLCFGEYLRALENFKAILLKVKFNRIIEF